VKTFGFDPGRIHLLSLDTGSDLYETVTDYVVEHDIRAASVAFIGAVRRARLAWWDQQEEAYRGFAVDEPMEVVSGLGSVSEADGRPFVHIHVSLADREGHLIGGHVEPGTEVYAMEITIQELVGEPLVFWETS
jgi:predicted DNA-binding protein with PD1-like motif